MSQHSISNLDSHQRVCPGTCPLEPGITGEGKATHSGLRPGEHRPLVMEGGTVHPAATQKPRSKQCVSAK